MINSEETMENAIDEIQNECSMMQIKGETISKLDFAVESIEIATDFGTRLLEFETGSKISAVPKLFGPYQDGFYVMRVYIDCENVGEALNFKCVDVGTRRTQSQTDTSISPALSEKSDDLLNSPSPNDDASRPTWNLPLPEICCSRESLHEHLEEYTMRMRLFYIRKDRRSNRIYGRHDGEKDHARCPGFFSYKMEKGEYRLKTSIAHTCARVVVDSKNKKTKLTNSESSDD